MSIEAVIAETVREAVKNAVSEALVPVVAKLEALEEKVNEIRSDVGTNECKCLDADEIVGPILEAIEDSERNRELNEGRAQLRLMREGKAS